MQGRGGEYFILKLGWVYTVTRVKVVNRYDTNGERGDLEITTTDGKWFIFWTEFPFVTIVILSYETMAWIFKQIKNRITKNHISDCEVSVCLADENRDPSTLACSGAPSPKVIKVDYRKDDSVYQTEEVQTYILQFNDVADTIQIKQRSNYDGYLNLAEVFFQGKVLLRSE